MEKKKFMSSVESLHREKVTRYSIRKVSFGAASVAVAALFMFLGNGAVAAAEQGVPSTNGETQAPQPKDQNVQNGTYEGNTVATSPAATVETNTQPSTVENSPYPELAPQKVETLDKKELADLIKEIDGKFAKGKYATKTEESVNNLRAVLEEAKATVNTATTEGELTQAHSRLVTATTQLKTKPEEKKEAPAVDTTNGKQTVGVKATNTEKVADMNSIANSGSRDERNGKALDKNKPFRTDSTTNADPAANQTYTAPAADADLNTLAKTLLALAPTVENNTKLSQNMDSLGDSKQVEKGTVKEIKEFGGWTAVDGGVFAIARRTEEGVYPLETINSTLNDTVWLREQAFDRDTEYTLLLSKSRTRANRNEEVFDGSKYEPTGVGSGITKNVAGYNGIEKTFTAYSTLYGSDVVVKFKPGYVGDSDGFKANYKVQVYSITGNQEKLVYETTFDPSKDVKNDGEKIVTRAKDGTNNATIKISKTPNSTTIDGGVDHTERVDFIGKTEAETLMAQPGNKPNGAAGTFTSKPIALPKGADHYKVRISLANQNRTGMSYQAWDKKYSVPVTGADFSIAQDTSRVAKSLLQRVYDKLLATVDEDKRGKTPETQAAYQAQLDAIKEALKPENLTSTKNYQNFLKLALETQSGLKVDKSALKASKEELDKLVDDDPTPGKTPETVAKYNEAKTAAEEEAQKAQAIIDSDNATVDQVAQAVAKINEKKEALETAKNLLVEAATPEEKTKLQTDSDSLKKADETGKTPESIAAYDKKYEEFKAELEAAKAAAAKALAKGTNATKEEVQAAQAKVDAVKTALEKAAELLVNKADKTELIKAKEALNTLATAADPTTGKTADSAKAYNDAKTAAQEAIQAAETVINDENATPEKVREALEKVNAKKTALQQAKDGLIEAATAEEKAKLKADADSLVKADETGKTPNSIAAYDRKYEELKSQLEEAKAAAAAVEAKANNATKAEVQEAQAKVDAAKAALDKAAELLKDLDRDAAKKEIADAAKKATDAIEASTSLTSEQKAEAKAKVAKEAKDATDAIDKATTEDGINSAKDNGKLAIEKAAAITAINAEKAAKEQEIDNNSKLSADEKASAKAEVAKAATEAVEAITNAKTQEKVNAAQVKGETAIKAVTPVGKEKALDAIQKAAEAKIAEIDKNDKLSADEKASAKAEVAKAAIEAVETIQKATTQEAVNAAQAKGETAIKAVNPIGKEKALEAIKATKEAKLAEIDKATGLSAEEKAVAKAAVEKAYNEAVEAIQKATTQEAVNAAQSKGEAAIKAINLLNEAKEAVKAAAAEKIASIEANPNLSAEEKAKAIAEVERLKQEALNAIDKAKTKAELDKALRTFLYQLDLESLVYDRPTFDLEAYIQASITGVVKVERGKAITQADIIAKLNLPENVTVISIDLPDTNTLGDKFAKVMLRLPDGTEVTVKVPVRVVASQNGDSKPETALPDYGRNNGATNTESKVDKAKLEGAIRQLDELIIKESAKLDAEIAKEANDLLADAKKVFANADANQAEVDAMVKRIEDFMAKVASSTDHATPANDQAAQKPAVAPATTQAAANASQEAATNARKAAKELPNTGTADSTVAMVAAAASALLGLGLAGRRRKEDEEA